MNEQTAVQRIESLKETGYSVQIGDAFGNGIEIFKKNMWPFVGFTALSLMMQSMAGVVPFLGIPISMILSTLSTVGYYNVAHKIHTGQEYRFDDFFGAFQKSGDYVVPMVFSILLTLLGTILLVIPGIYLSVAYSFVLLFVIHFKAKGMQALDLSRKLVHRNWFGVFGFLFVLGLFNLLGMLMLGVGYLFTYPISVCAVYAMFYQLMSLNSTEEQSIDDFIGSHLVD